MSCVSDNFKIINKYVPSSLNNNSLFYYKKKQPEEIKSLNGDSNILFKPLNIINIIK